MNQKYQAPLAVGEFVALMATIISLTALSIDAMLPALPNIAADLGAHGDNDGQLVISFMFVGFAVGQMLYGPLSDSIGRKPAIYAGIAVFVVGCGMSLLASNFALMLAGRVLQGIGAASPRIVSVAMVRDQYEGRAMARIMSMIMAVFIVVPAVAPAVGQAVLLFGHWRAIFGLLLLQAMVAWLWLAWRQPETLPAAQRRPLSLRGVLKDIVEVLRYRVTLGYTLTAGSMFGAFVGYLMSAQQIFQGLYDVGKLFPLFFGSLAVTIGFSSIVNSKLVMRFGTRRMCYSALIGVCVLAFAFLGLAHSHVGSLPLTVFMAYMMLSFFCVGILFGNFNTMAMEPLGHIAGVGAAVVGSLSTVVSLILGTLIGQNYDGTVLPLVGGFAILATLSLVVMLWTESRRTTVEEPSGA